MKAHATVEPAVIKERKSTRLGRASCSPSATGTAATSGQPILRRTGRTVLTSDGVLGVKSNISAAGITLERVKLAAQWRKSASGGGSMSAQEYAEAALTAAVRADLAGNPDFKLPPHLAFKS
jgi:hypothetical protein